MEKVFFSGLFRNKLLRWLGMLAYGTYLIHNAVQGFIFALIWGQQPQINSFSMLLGTLASLAITLLIASLSRWYFESPLIRFGHHFGYQFQVPRSPALVEAGGD